MDTGADNTEYVTPTSFDVDLVIDLSTISQRSSTLPILKHEDSTGVAINNFSIYDVDASLITQMHRIR
ncbi:hypothetical protein OH492_09260 [Vibrio chagasii]|nr:hypothetical protein [Vibrio chagasii]